MNRLLLLVVCCTLIAGATSGCFSDSGPIVPDKTWLERWESSFAENTRAILVGGHAREVAPGEYEVRGYFVSFASDFPASSVTRPYFNGWLSEGGGDGLSGFVPAMDLTVGESYTLVSPLLHLPGTVRKFTIDPYYDPIPFFGIHCPFKDASTVCKNWLAGFSPSDVTEHFLYDRLGAWEMPTIDIIDLACSNPLISVPMTCTFGAWNWYDLTPANATLTARLRARDDGLFRVVQEWDIPFGEPLAHNDTRPFTVELGNATQWVIDHETNEFYVEIVAQRPDNPVSMSQLMTRVIVNPLDDARG